MFHIGIIGHFGGKNQFTDGQTVKTKELYKLLQEHSECTIRILDTYNVARKPFSLIVKVINLLRSCRKIIIILSSRGYRFLLPILILFNLIFRREIFDFVIGGYRHNYLRENHFLCYLAKKCTYTFVETNGLEMEYSSLGFKNCKCIPNFKNLKIVSDLTDKSSNEPYKICTFSRITKEKGIEDAIDAVKLANEIMGHTVFTLTIFGVPDKKYEEKFEQLKAEFPDFISYGGLVDPTKTTDILKDFFLLLFPTYHNGEGFPGTLVDAFASGLPAIASDWNYNSEVIIDRRCGRIVPPRDVKALADMLIYLAERPDLVQDMRNNCIAEAKKYMPANALSEFLNIAKR